MKSLLVACVGMFLGSSAPQSLVAQTPAGAPWEVDLTERILARTANGDPASRSTVSDRRQFLIRGKDNPELLLPTEVFDALLGRGFATNATTRAVYREALESRARHLGFTSDSWAKLQRVSRSYLAVRRDQKVLSVDRCRLRFDALNDARVLFGDWFDRFLYESVAPTMNLAVIPEPDDAAQLSYVERGCQ